MFRNASDDVCLGFVFMYESLRYGVRRSLFDDLENSDLRLYPGDTDWHVPLGIHLRPEGGKRKRSAAATARRAKRSREHYTARHSGAASSSGI